MQFLKYVLITIATTGLIASIYIAFHRNTLDGFFEHLVNNILLILIAFNLKKIDSLFKTIRS